jgi:hypothetical protein
VATTDTKKKIHQEKRKKQSLNRKQHTPGKGLAQSSKKEGVEMIGQLDK